MVEKEKSISEETTEKPEVQHSLDKEVLSQKDGYIPGWDKVVTELDLFDLPRGEKKLFRSFFRAHRLYAIGRNVKGKRLMDSLIGRQNFIALEQKYPNELRRLVDMFSKRR